ncbi:hypothetical protein pipiens_002149 [Culex pipiens pipiens]|uniref:Uncharacterized protein n=1 Tax=Culex pipiens pipiens TaxID=38569 RepID=A0ABD1DJI5_CULPP
MNTYLWTAALLACFLALGGRGYGDLIVDLCGENITDANLEEELGKLTRDKIVIDLCDNQLKNFHRDLFRRFDRLDQLVFDGNPDLGFPPDGSPFLVVKSLIELQCVKCGVEKIFNRSLQAEPMVVSDCYISIYLTIITLALIGTVVILVGVWLKKKKYDSELKLSILTRATLIQVQSTDL